VLIWYTLREKIAIIGNHRKNLNILLFICESAWRAAITES